MFPLITDPGAYLVSKFQGETLIGGRRLNEGGTYFKVRGIIPMKFQNFVIFFFQVAINNYPYGM